jgi:hypothetical protein
VKFWLYGSGCIETMNWNRSTTEVLFISVNGLEEERLIPSIGWSFRSWIQILLPKLTTICQELEFFENIFKISRQSYSGKFQFSKMQSFQESSFNYSFYFLAKKRDNFVWSKIESELDLELDLCYQFSVIFARILLLARFFWSSLYENLHLKGCLMIKNLILISNWD